MALEDRVSAFQVTEVILSRTFPQNYNHGGKGEVTLKQTVTSLLFKVIDMVKLFHRKPRLSL
jgi:hypothetical protein